jgi:hypothetical protein
MMHLRSDIYMENRLNDKLSPGWKKRFKSLGRICRWCGKGISLFEESHFYHEACRKLLAEYKLEMIRQSRIARQMDES